MSNILIPIEIKDESLMPVYSTSGAAGADVWANISEPIILEPNSMVPVPTGIKLEIPNGYEIQVRPRSGLAAKFGLTVLNTPGTIDSDYRGEIIVLLINLGKHAFSVTPKMRIAQLILAPVYRAEFIPVQISSSTDRGSGGFGHTGLHGIS